MAPTTAGAARDVDEERDREDVVEEGRGSAERSYTWMQPSEEAEARMVVVLGVREVEDMDGGVCPGSCIR